MAEAMRGTKLGARSYESEIGVELAPRQEVTYDCPLGHVTEMPFSVEADVPATWECRVCGEEAKVRHGSEPEPVTVKVQRTHWDMLLERRTNTELESVLQERLALLRERGGATRASHDERVQAPAQRRGRRVEERRSA